MLSSREERRDADSRSSWREPRNEDAASPLGLQGVAVSDGETFETPVGEALRLASHLVWTFANVGDRAASGPACALRASRHAQAGKARRYRDASFRGMYNAWEMPSRHADWFKQAKRDHQHARHALEDQDYEWACFASHQAAEKAVKALYQRLGAEARGHSVHAFLEQLPAAHRPGEELSEAAKELDKHYIPSRYPNSYSEGAPFEYYTQREAERAIDNAGQIVRFCEDHLA